MCQRCAARCWHVAACAAVVWVCCADRILLCVVIQGHILQAFSPANKVEVAHMVYVDEYNPIVRLHAEACTDVPVCASMSMAAGDRITVMQVGTVGVAASGDQDSQGIRTIVQHAVLVLLTPADGGAQRCEVLTGKQLCKRQYMVAWLHSGHPTMDARKVHIHLCLETCLICHEYLLIRHETIVVRHENMLIRHETTVVRHEHMIIRHETTVVRHENG